MALYRLCKIQDFISTKDIISYDSMKDKLKNHDLPYNYSKMCFRPAYAHVPSKIALSLLDKIKKKESLSEEDK